VFQRINNRLRIRHRLMIAFGLVVIYLILNSGINIMLNNRDQKYRDEVSSSQQEITLVQTLRAEIMSARFIERTTLAVRLAQGYEASLSSYASFSPHIEAAVQLLEQLKHQNPDAEELRNIESIEADLQAFRTALDQMVLELIPQRGDAQTGQAGELVANIEQLRQSFMDRDLTEAELITADIQRAIGSYLVTPSLDSVGGFTNGINRLEALLPDLPLAEDEKNDLLDLLSTIQNGFTALTFSDGAMVTLTFDNQELVNQIDATMQAIIQAELDDAQQAEAVLAEAEDTRNTYNMLIQSFIFFATALTLFLTYRSITRPIHDLIQASHRIADGAYDQRITAQKADEVGDLAHAFNDMAEAVYKRDAEMRDQSDRLSQNNIELAAARTRAEESNTLKSQFLATMSHELRTPLNAIIGYTQIMMEGMAGQPTEQQTKFLKRVFTNGNDLLHLIDDILDLSKVEAGRMELVKLPFEVRPWVQNLCTQVEPQLKAKNLVLNMVIDAQLPDRIIGDPDRLKQIALNLLSNAIKFTHEGHIDLTLQRREKTLWELIVSDTGIGIPATAQEYIFDSFRQVDGSSRREYGGTGLGLSIVRHLSLLMGGTIRVQSEIGQGSTFTVLLPLIEGDNHHGTAS